jgi:hypothetical protein
MLRIFPGLPHAHSPNTQIFAVATAVGQIMDVKPGATATLCNGCVVGAGMDCAAHAAAGLMIPKPLTIG